MKYIDPEVAIQKVKDLPKYATLKEFKDIIKPALIHEHGDDALAVDVLSGPITSYTTLPYWIVSYLYGNRDKMVEGDVFNKAATKAGYRWQDLRPSVKYLGDTQANFGAWSEPDKERKGKYKYYYRWYDPDEKTDAGAVMRKTQECLDRGDDW